MIRRPPRSTRTDTLFPYTTLFRARSENLQQVPISVAAVSAERLQAAGVVSIQQLSSAVAGLTVNQTTRYFSPHLRGVGTSFFGPAIENPVGISVDTLSYRRPEERSVAKQCVSTS